VLQNLLLLPLKTYYRSSQTDGQHDFARLSWTIDPQNPNHNKGLDQGRKQFNAILGDLLSEESGLESKDINKAIEDIQKVDAFKADLETADLFAHQRLLAQQMPPSSTNYGGAIRDWFSILLFTKKNIVIYL